MKKQLIPEKLKTGAHTFFFLSDAEVARIDYHPIYTMAIFLLIDIIPGLGQ